ncbi:MAG: 50S ribosomal protein L19, partial [Dehalococcoidia bacterium]|nr:50S ribosomal protein L19 [Dehalococcoidia bacterium]
MTTCRVAARVDRLRRARLYYLRDRVGKATRVIEGGALSREELDALKAPLELDTGAAPAAKGDKADKKADKKAAKK